MIILDTSVWIEHLKKNQIYFEKICELLESGEVLGVTGCEIIYNLIKM